MRAWCVLLRTTANVHVETIVLGRYDNCRTTSFANARWMCGSLRLLAHICFLGLSCNEEDGKEHGQQFADPSHPANKVLFLVEEHHVNSCRWCGGLHVSFYLETWCHKHRVCCCVAVACVRDLVLGNMTCRDVCFCSAQ